MMLSYENNFKSHRADGRFSSSMAAYMQFLREVTPNLSLPQTLDKDTFSAWQGRVKEKARELLCMPDYPDQPQPVRLSTVRRDGYSVEKWEFYPDPYSAVPVLILIPDTATEQTPVPGVFCFPGSVFSKEFIAGEPLLDSPACRFEKYPERNRMAKYVVENGMAAFAFDNVETAECAVGEELYGPRSQLCSGYLQYGFNYPGISAYQKLCFMKFARTLPYIDNTRLAVCAHSLGTTDALFTALLNDDIKAVVFNDYVCSWRKNYVAVTEEDERRMSQDSGNWHLLPGLLRWFDRPDLLAALAPKYLALNEGGAECNTREVMRAYAAVGASDRVYLSHYTKYADEATRTHHDDMPLYGLTEDEKMAYNYVDAPDHSFRKEPSMRLLKMAFGLS